MTPLTLTLIGQDRPGLVQALSEQVAAAGGNWLESRMARLAGQFAGILLVEVPDEGADALTRSLRTLEEQGLKVTVTRGAKEETPGRTYRTLMLDLIGQDRPGIVREIAQALASHGVNIDELETKVETGSFSSESLFRAQARLRVPDTVDPAALRDRLEGLANELMVDISLAPPAA